MENQQSQVSSAAPGLELAYAGFAVSRIVEALKGHWPEYLMEAAELGIFMISACLFTTLLWHPASPVFQAVPNMNLRRVLTGIAMGLTGISIVYSPWGKRSGAHFNPSFTLSFFALGKVDASDAVFYITSQFAGAVAGVVAASFILGDLIYHPSVNFAVTQPGIGGARLAFLAELIISFFMMTTVLLVSNTPRLARFTGLFAGFLVATYISVEGPLSGMSMNPARTFGSAFSAHLWTALWVYFTAPPLGMLLAAGIHRLRTGRAGVICAKLHHHNDKRCIFRCGYRREKNA